MNFLKARRALSRWAEAMRREQQYDRAWRERTSWVQSARDKMLEARALRDAAMRDVGYAWFASKGITDPTADDALDVLLALSIKGKGDIDAA